jgi:hypothetical protein
VVDRRGEKESKKSKRNMHCHNPGLGDALPSFRGSFLRVFFFCCLVSILFISSLSGKIADDSDYQRCGLRKSGIVQLLTAR